MVLWGRHSDRTGERKWHLALPGVVGMIGFLLGGFIGNFYVAVVGFTLGAIGIGVVAPRSGRCPPAILGGSAAAGGIALINSIGNLEWLLRAVPIGKLKDLAQKLLCGGRRDRGGLALAAVLGYVVGRLAPDRTGALRTSSRRSSSPHCAEGRQQSRDDTSSNTA